MSQYLAADATIDDGLCAAAVDYCIQNPDLTCAFTTKERAYLYTMADPRYVYHDTRLAAAIRLKSLSAYLNFLTKTFAPVGGILGSTIGLQPDDGLGCYNLGDDMQSDGNSGGDIEMGDGGGTDHLAFYSSPGPLVPYDRPGAAFPFDAVAELLEILRRKISKVTDICIDSEEDVMDIKDTVTEIKTLLCTVRDDTNAHGCTIVGKVGLLEEAVKAVAKALDDRTGNVGGDSRMGDIYMDVTKVAEGMDQLLATGNVAAAIASDQSRQLGNLFDAFKGMKTTVLDQYAALRDTIMADSKVNRETNACVNNLLKMVTDFTKTVDNKLLITNNHLGSIEADQAMLAGQMMVVQAGIERIPDVECARAEAAAAKAEAAAALTFANKAYDESHTTAASLRAADRAAAGNYTALHEVKSMFATIVDKLVPAIAASGSGATPTSSGVAGSM